MQQCILSALWTLPLSLQWKFKTTKWRKPKEAGSIVILQILNTPTEIYVVYESSLHSKFIILYVNDVSGTMRTLAASHSPSAHCTFNLHLSWLELQAPLQVITLLMSEGCCSPCHSHTQAINFALRSSRYLCHWIVIMPASCFKFKFRLLRSFHVHAIPVSLTQISDSDLDRLQSFKFRAFLSRWLSFLTRTRMCRGLPGSACQ